MIPPSAVKKYIEVVTAYERISAIEPAWQIDFLNDGTYEWGGATGVLPELVRKVPELTPDLAWDGEAGAHGLLYANSPGSPKFC